MGRWVMAFNTSNMVGVRSRKADGTSEYIDPVSKDDAMTRDMIDAGACTLLAYNKFMPNRVAVGDGGGTIQPSPITTAELGTLDGGTSDSGVSIADADRFIHNDAGTMRQTSFTRVWSWILGKMNGGVSTVITSNLTGNKVLISDGSGKIATSTMSAASINSTKKVQIMQYPTSSGPYWSFMSINNGAHSIQINLSGNKVVFNNQVLVDYYMTVTEHNQTSANSTLSTATTKMRRDRLSPTGSLDALVFSGSSHTKARVILSSYGGTYFAPLVFDFDIFRHDSNSVIVHCEFNELVNV